MRYILTLKRYFIPHKHNGYKPHFFREKGVLALCFVALVAFLGSLLHQLLITNTNLLAEIFPRALVELANRNRLEQNLRVLRTNPILERAAKLKVNDMVTKGYFAHTSPEGLEPWEWFKFAGYTFSYAGENLAIDFSDSVDVNRAWMSSPGHRANILNNNFTEIGVALGKSYFEGRETTFVVQMFGRPLNDEFLQPASVVEMSAAPALEGLAESTGDILEVEEIVSSEVLPTAYGNEMFVAVANIGAEQRRVSSETSVFSASPTPSSFIETMATSPKRNLSYFYLLLSGVVGLALALMVFIKIRIQHPRNIAYGFGMIAFFGLLMFLYHGFVAVPVSVL